MSEHHDHDHDHGKAPHVHPKQPDLEDAPMGYYERLATALEELMVEKGVVTADEVRAQIEWIDSRTPAFGARVVAHAWVDPAYKQRLLQNGSAAVEELGITMDGTKLIVVENTPQVHNMVVCTLCSCYPRPLLGLPPDWYKGRVYRSRAVRAPRALLAEFGTFISESVEIRVHDSTATMRYLVLPLRPAGTEGWSEEELAALVTRDSMIGVAVIKPPAREPAGAD
jgi:nitrile hydratase alpha subunit